MTGKSAKGLGKALQAAGGPAALARSLKLSTQAVAQWPHVPVKHVLKIERVTGVSRYEMRPDIYGERPERGAA